MNCPENQYKKKTQVGWGGNFRGPKIKSPGNVMNCPENQKKIQNPVGGGGGVEVLGGQKIKSWKCHELPRIFFLNPGGGWGGVEVLGVNNL